MKLFLPLILALGLSGCIHQPTGAAPPTPQTRYQQAAIIMDGAAGEIQIAQTALINLHKAGKVPDDTYYAIQNIFKSAGNYGIQIDKLLSIEASSQTLTDTITNAIHGFVGISTVGLDAQTAAQINGYTQAVIAILNQLLPLFDPAKVSGISAPTEEIPWTLLPSQPLRSQQNSSSSAASTPTDSTKQQQPTPAYQSSRSLKSWPMQMRSSLRS